MRNRAGACRAGLSELCWEVWSAAGVRVLGSLIGNEKSSDHISRNALPKNGVCGKRFLRPQTSVRLVQGRAPTTCYAQPSQINVYVAAHDVSMWRTALQLMGDHFGSEEDLRVATQLSTLPQGWAGPACARHSVARQQRIGRLWRRRCRSSSGEFHQLPPLSSRPWPGNQARTKTRDASWRCAPRAPFSRAKDSSSCPTGQRCGTDPGRSRTWELSRVSGPTAINTSSPPTREHHFRRSVVLSQSLPADQAHLRSRSLPTPVRN